MIVNNDNNFVKILEFKEVDNLDTCVVMPIYNASHILSNSLAGLSSSISQNSHVILILDNCHDQSELLCTSWFSNQIKKKSTFGITIYKTLTSMHETRCDNFAFQNHKAKIAYLEVQADIVLEESDLDIKLAKCFKLYPELFAISGRGTHLWQLPYNPKLRPRVIFEILIDIFGRTRTKKNYKLNLSAGEILELDDIDFYENWGFGKIGIHTEAKVEVNQKRKIYLSETVMRGPISFNANALQRLNYLNEKAHPLAGDDHEVTLRAWLDLGLRSGYMPIAYESQIEWGADRSKKPIKEELSNLFLRLKQASHRKESRLFLESSNFELWRPNKGIIEVSLEGGNQ